MSESRSERYEREKATEKAAEAAASDSNKQTFQMTHTASVSATDSQGRRLNPDGSLARDSY